MQTAAIYLPGFHECELNSLWWGAGATEWDSVRSARSLAANHQQPRTPLWGYYDLSDPRIIAKQAAVAKEFGIDGFCIYHYWSEGISPLKKPLELILDNPDLEIRFCLCWANHSWSTTWKGLLDNYPRRLMSQTYEKTKELRQPHINLLLRALSDKRAMRVNDRPVISIYDPTPTADMADFVDHLRSDAKEQCGVDILCSAWAHTPYHLANIDKLLLIFDNISLTPSIREIKHRRLETLGNRLPPALKLGILKYIYWRLERKRHHQVQRIDYDNFIKEYLIEYRALSSSHKGKIDAQLLVDWDNTPRHKSRGAYFHNFHASKLSHFASDLKSAVIESNPESILYINAWNEWGEGAYLEPDTSSRTARLEAISKALTKR